MPMCPFVYGAQNANLREVVSTVDRGAPSLGDVVIVLRRVEEFVSVVAGRTGTGRLTMTAIGETTLNARTESPSLASTPTLYTQTGCAESVRVRDWLTKRAVAFSERNVSHDPEAAEALYATGIFATPLLLVGERRVLGFRPDALAEVLEG